MADNTTLSLGTGGDVIGSDDIAGVKFQRVKLIHGADGINDGDVATANPLPVTVGNFPATQPVSAATLPLPSGAATETTAAGIRTDLGTDGTTPPAVLGTGTGVRGWLRSIYEKLTGTIAVTGTFFQATQPVSGPVTDTQLRATAVPVSGTFFQATQPVSLATAPVTPVTDNAGSLTVDAPVGTPAFVRLSDGAAAIATLPVSMASLPTLAAGVNNIGDVDVLTLPALVAGTAIIGALVANQSVNTAQIAGVATAVGSGVSGTGVQRVVLATDVIQPASAEIRAATLHVTGTAAANTSLTVTLPAVAGMFHYITAIHLMRNATAALAGTATLIHTSTNLPGNPAWSVGNLMVAGGTQLDLNYSPTTPLRSAVVNTATTIVMPAAGAAVLNRINVSYFTAA